MELRQLTSALSLLMVLQIFPPTALSADQVDEAQSRSVLVIDTTDWYADGRRETTREAIEAGPEGVFELSGPIGHAARSTRTAAVTTAKVENTRHWAPGTNKINYLVTKIINQLKYRAKIKTVVVKYGNKPRGTKAAPAQIIKKKTTKITPLEEFQNPGDFYTQKYFNGKNEIIMTEDDQFFKDPNGLFFDPNSVIRTIVFTFGQFFLQGNQWVGTLWIVEADVLIRSDFFNQPLFNFQLALAAAFHATLGYPATIWTHDIMGLNRPYVTEAAFRNLKSDTWMLMKQRDRDYYDGLVKAAADSSTALTPFIRPEQHALLDIGGEVLPDPNPFDPAEPIIPIFHYTNLTGPDKLMIVKISRVDRSGNNPRLRAIATLKGKMQDWPLNASFGKAYPTVFHNTATFFSSNKGRIKFDKLKDVVAQFGQPMQVNGIPWNRVLEIEVKITGQDTQAGFQAAGKKSVKQRYYVINSDNEAPLQGN